MWPFNLIDPNIFGIFGAIMGNVLFLPQIIKGFKTKSMGDLAVMTYILILINDIFWVMFGLGVDQPIVWVANTVSGVLSTLLICMIGRYK